MLGKGKQGKFGQRVLPSDSSLLDRHHGQDHAPILVRIVWRCTGMLMQSLGTSRGSHPRHASHPICLSHALSQAILPFGRRHLRVQDRGVRDRDLASKVGQTEVATRCTHTEYEPRNAKHEEQFMDTMRWQISFGHAAVPADAVVIGSQRPRSAEITL
jgi:hypothetical protein